jgi:hypothetical protein
MSAAPGVWSGGSTFTVVAEIAAGVLTVGVSPAGVRLFLKH